MGMRPPTDFELLKAIYERHRDEFARYVEGAADGRSSKILVPIDITAVAERFGVDADIIFGRLYYHLDPKYGEASEEGERRKVLFTPVAGPDRNCVNFPLLEAVLAGLWQERRRDLLAHCRAVTRDCSVIAVRLGSRFVALVPDRPNDWAT